jgi:hypothetical protein
MTFGHIGFSTWRPRSDLKISIMQLTQGSSPASKGESSIMSTCLNQRCPSSAEEVPDAAPMVARRDPETSMHCGNATKGEEDAHDSPADGHLNEGRAARVYLEG